MSSDSSPKVLAYPADYPALFESVDQQSKEAQSRFLRLTAVRLVCLFVAAAFGAITWDTQRLDISGIVAAVAFFTALLVELQIRNSGPESTWYQARAAAESAKTLTWRYSVGGNPLGLSLPTEEVDALFLSRLRQIQSILSNSSLTIPAGSQGQITTAMRALRAQDLSKRIASYKIGRIEDQRSWYENKSRENGRLAKRWRTYLIAVESTGVLGAALKAANVIDLDLLGIVSAVVAGMVVWLQSKSYENLCTSYALASQELATIESRISLSHPEDQWADFVDQSEEAISREHTMWLASRTK